MLSSACRLNSSPQRTSTRSVSPTTPRYEIPGNPRRRHSERVRLDSLVLVWTPLPLLSAKTLRATNYGISTIYLYEVPRDLGGLGGRSTGFSGTSSGGRFWGACENLFDVQKTRL
ncbi:hypothetical protein CEXT_546461 [Caerostris extrusa]|uniref:Uncharacterized protein n=1 Tax=Caerostris extrusa TaxID=172846 RepID=A0AAV4MAI0_CAEEX|nr:hypothetical protein CEXT_546461 [Caerostris extrusa]